MAEPPHKNRRQRYCEQLWESELVTREVKNICTKGMIVTVKTTGKRIDRDHSPLLVELEAGASKAALGAAVDYCEKVTSPEECRGQL